MKRTGKWYRKNERSVMEALGLQPTPNSGSGWLVKEDGQNEHVLCQLKSTDANSIKVSLQDIQTLQYNAGVAHKLPVFAIQYIGTGDVYCIVKPEDMPELVKYIETGVYKQPDQMPVSYDQPKQPKRKTIKSSAEARQAFQNEVEEKYKKKVRHAT